MITAIKSLLQPHWFSDLLYTLKRYKRTFGKYPNLIFPKTFNEKIQHRKLFFRDPLLTTLADKYAVREYVAERVGEKYLNDLYQVVDKAEDLDFDHLPNQFVLKATHGSGWNIIVRDKANFDKKAAIQQLNEWLSQNYYDLGREWCYKNIKPRIIAEKILINENMIPIDYKFYCFSSHPKFIQVDIDRDTRHTKNIYDDNWNFLHVQYVKRDHAINRDKPSTLIEMKHVAQKLSKGLDFLRVDLYEVKNRIIFGELTNYPNNGFGQFNPQKYDALFGSFWK